MQKKEKKVKVTTVTYLDPLFKVGDIVMFKENLFMVKIGDVTVKRNKYVYKVRYNHKDYGGPNYGWFEVYEDELEEKPFDYERLLLNAYLEYRCKYEGLLKSLTSKY